MIEAYVTNLGKYNEGELCGEYLTLPAQKADVQSLLSRIGVDGVLYEEIFITDYKTDIPGLHGCLGEYESVDELNYLASILEDMNEAKLAKFSAAVEYGEHTDCANDLINLVQNLDCYDFYPDVHNEEELGYYLIDELDMLAIPENIEPYFDYETYGRNISLVDSGIFVTHGYVVRGNGFVEHYKSSEDIPSEHKIFAYPDMEKMNMRDRLNMYQRMIPILSATDRNVPQRDEHV